MLLGLDLGRLASALRICCRVVPVMECSSILYFHFYSLIEVVDAVSICDAKFWELNVTLLLSIDVVPDFANIITRQRDFHALNH